MANDTIIQQGTFTSGGVAKTLVLRSDVDWIETINLTTTAASTQWDSTRHYWTRGMAAGQSIIDFHAAASQVISTTTSIAGFNGVANRQAFYPINSSTLANAAPIAITGGTDVAAPVYSTGNTGFLTTGSIVRIYGTAHTEVNGLDFTVGTVVANTSFALGNALMTQPGVIAGAAGFWKYVAPDLATYKLFYPGVRTIASIVAATGTITTLVDHGLSTGQKVRLKVPASCGMTELNDMLATVTVTTASAFTIDIDTSAFTAFKFPLPAAVPCSFAEVVPMGEQPSLLTMHYGDATSNQGYIGMILGSGGAVSGTPTGVANDVIFWRAGKSFGM